MRMYVKVMAGHCMYIAEWRSALGICNYPRYRKSELV